MASTASGEPPPKKAKVRHYAQKFREEYSKKYPCIVASQISSEHARCVPCELDFKIAHGGIDDIKRHCLSTRHIEKSGALNNSTKLTSFFSSSKSDAETSSQQAIIRSETLFTQFLVEHNVPLSASDHAGPLFRAMFPDSKIAKQYGCARTKTTQIVKACSKAKAIELADCMRSGPFVLGTDGSQEGGDKCYPIVVRCLKKQNEITTELLCNPTCPESSTGENIFKVLDTELSSLDIKWDNCMALVSDNAYVMTGEKKGVISFVRKKQKNVFLAGCVCHLLSLALKKGMKAGSKFDLDDHMRQLYWYVSKSSGRQQRLRQLQQKCGVPEHQLIAHVPTRWLSLGAALARVVEQWEPLCLFLKDECSLKKCDSQSSPAILSSLKDFFKRRTPKLYVLFCLTVIEMFDKVNKQLQTDHARIHLIKRDIEQLFRKLLVCFVKPSALNQGTLMAVDFTSKYNMKPEDQLFIGSQARSHLESGIDLKEKEIFFKNVKAMYQAICTYIVEKINPCNQPLWKHAEVADIKNKDAAMISSVDFFLEKFPCLLEDGVTKDIVHCEFLEYQAEISLPAEVMQLEHAEEQWKRMSQVKDHNGKLKFGNLARVMQGILLIPVSNCACERIFSLVRKKQD